MTRWNLSSNFTTSYTSLAPCDFSAFLYRRTHWYTHSCQLCSTTNSGQCRQLVTLTFDLAFRSAFCRAKVRSKSRLKSKSKMISLSERLSERLSQKLKSPNVWSQWTETIRPWATELLHDDELTEWPLQWSLVPNGTFHFLDQSYAPGCVYSRYVSCIFFQCEAT